MFCEQCGKALEIDGDFCGGCGAPRYPRDKSNSTKLLEQEIAEDSFRKLLEDKAAQYETDAGFDSVPSQYLDISGAEEFEEWARRLQDETLPIRFQLEGFVNAEVGAVWFSTRPFYSCVTCQQQVAFEFRQVDCADCFRTASNFCSAPIGKGDGTYPVYQGQTANGSGFLAVLATEAGEDGQGAINQLLSKVLARDFSAVKSREALVKVPVISLLTHPEYVVTKVGTLTIEAEDIGNGAYRFPGLSQILVSGPRTLEHLDCAEVRVGWEPGDFEILAITRGSAVEAVNTALSSARDEVPYFDRPDILAVLVVRSTDVRNLFPGYKKIPLAQDVRLFERTDRWVELTRPLQGYLFAILANWELLNHYLGELGETEWALPELYQSMVAEGYLHQIWTLNQTNPPTIQRQISELGALGSSFDAIVDLCAQPGSRLTRADLQKWFLQEPVSRFSKLGRKI